MSIPQSVGYTVMMKVYLSSDHVSPGTALTMAVVISKAGGAFGNPSAGASNATEVSNGWYKFALSTTDTNTVGDLVVRLTGTSADDSERVLQVVDANTGGLGALPAVAAGSAGCVMTTTSTLAEAYPGVGGNATIAQLLYEMAQNLAQFAISGTTITVYKRDGVTTAETYTLDSSTSPTSRSRTT